MLTGKRIFLRRFRTGDAPILLKWGKNPRYHKLAGFEQLSNLDDAKRAARQYALRNGSLAICLKNNEEVIGLVELYERGMDERSGLLKTKEIGFLLDQEFEGNGYMTEALNLVIKEAFENEDQVEIWAGTFENNIRSQKLLNKLGFKYVYDVDYGQVTNLFSYKEKYYLLKKEEWLKIVSNTKS